MLGYKKRFTVWVYLDGKGEYVRIPREYRDEATARAVFRCSKNFDSQNDPMLMREETAMYSDLQTRKESLFTNYTALL